MPVMVKLRPAAKLTYIGFEQGEAVEAVAVHRNNYALEVRLSALPTEKAATVDIGSISPRRYTALITVHPQLVNECPTLPSTIIAEPDEELPLVFTAKAPKTLDLQSLPWHVRIYLID
jgi:hypothetical protein